MICIYSCHRNHTSSVFLRLRRQLLLAVVVCMRVCERMCKCNAIMQMSAIAVS